MKFDFVIQSILIRWWIVLYVKIKLTTIHFFAFMDAPINGVRFKNKSLISIHISYIQFALIQIISFIS